MAEAGWPLRQETFYYTHRRGGPHYLPIDVKKYVRDLILQISPTDADLGYLADSGYPMGGGFVRALTSTPDMVKVDTLPKGSWFFDREPAFSVTGPSALVSWLEPQLLMLNFRIQYATALRLNPDSVKDMPATCTQQAAIMRDLQEEALLVKFKIDVKSEAYFEHVLFKARKLVGIVKDPSRIFEVGMRGVSCMDEHELCLRACKAAGIFGTSNVFLAKKLKMTPIGTMGHEHVQRYGSDRAAFWAMVDRTAGASSFLLDTFSTLDSGIPAAYKIIQRQPERNHSIRFDSGDKRSQYIYAVTMARGMKIEPLYILEDGFDDVMTQEFEELRSLLKVPANQQFYGYGGYLTSWDQQPLQRNVVAAVYKVTISGDQPTMKFSEGKDFIPGIPLLARPASPQGSKIIGLVFQQGETIPSHFIQVTGVVTPHHYTTQNVKNFVPERPQYSAETQKLVDELRSRR